MGAQANVWTEYILSEKQVEYMALPRMCALAEVLWTPREKKDPTNFQDRLIQHFSFLDQWDINYSKSIYQVQMKPAVKDNEYGVNMFLKRRLGGITYSMIPLDNPDSAEYGGMGYNPHTDHFPPYIDTSFYAINKSGTFKIQLGDFSSTSITLYISKSTAKKITFNTPPSNFYNTEQNFTLVNGVKADLPRKNNQWNAWSGTHVEIIIDLNNVQEISQVEIGYLQHLNDWIWLPKTITIDGSMNGKKYKNLQTLSSETIQQNPRQVLAGFKKTKARYIKIKAYNPGKIPQGYAGAGEDSWLFFDEILID
jgi:hexosaminidase